MSSTEPTDRNMRCSMVVFAVTILLSAFLLFQVQPLVSKAILPWFGGAPAVWTTCMLFFQTFLFAGYVYADLLQRWLAPRHQVLVHLIVVGLAMLALPIGPGVELKPADNANPTWQILLLLAWTVGLPYFALSATSPLVQAWFSRRCPGRSPYRLYALSNVGSLAALLTYPFYFEPALALPAQSTLWSRAFVVYGALCMASLISLRHVGKAGPAGVGEESEIEAGPPTWGDWLRWLALPACASWMLLAATNHICQDVAVVPFLWVLPLTLYLLSFILCFDHPRWYVRPLWATLAAVAMVGVAYADHLKHAAEPPSLVQELIVNCVALFCVCMACHGELVRLKPRPRHLTEFYLLISAGGALGGLFVGLAAPALFSTFLEWPIGMMISAALAMSLLILPGPGGKLRLARYFVLGPLAAVGLFCLVRWEFDIDFPLDRARNFFGVVSVLDERAETPEFHSLCLRHGRITHGRQFVDPVKRRWATTYFGDNSGVGKAAKYLHRTGPIRIGIIGLGIGTIAAHARPGDVVRFYEINPEVVRMAKKYFTYLTDCRGETEIVLGDARLALEAEPRQHYDLLVVDAFSGDSIPTHLLTREAFEVYRSHLNSDGILAVHISNTYLRLAPVVRRLAEECGMKATRLCAASDPKRLLESNEWMLVTSDEGFVRTHPSEPNPDDDRLVVPLWTDQYSNLFQILVGNIWGR